MSENSEDYPPDFELPLNRPQIIEDFKFTPLKVVGKGSFGIVYQISSTQFEQPLALKIVLQDRRYKNRELQILQQINHPCCTRLLRYFLLPSSTNADDQILYIVMNYYPETLSSIYKQYTRLKQHVPLIYVRILMFQLGRALLELHSAQISHRDVKPANVLVDPQTLSAVLCDFGSAKVLKRGEPNVSYICSRFYRAPELILGVAHYGLAIDIWSYGCILAEVLLGQPLFPGESSVDQFVEIVKVLGSPSGQEFAAMNPALEDVRMKEVKPYGLSKIFRQKTHQEAVDLINQCLQYDPAKRFTISQILQHPFFAKIATIGKQLPGGEPVCDLFNFTDAEKAAMGSFCTKFTAKQEGVNLDDMEDMEV